MLDRWRATSEVSMLIAEQNHEQGILGRFPLWELSTDRLRSAYFG